MIVQPLSAHLPHCSISHVISCFMQFTGACFEQNTEALRDSPNTDVLWSCMGFAHFRRGSYTEAFDHYLRAKTAREIAQHLGPRHVDTALVCHNLGCTLDRLGETRWSVLLLTQALKTFSSVLGEGHPRRIVAERNFWRIKHNCPQVGV